MIQERYGENMGRIDPQYPFIKLYRNHCCSDDTKKELAEKSRKLMVEIDEKFNSGEKLMVYVRGYWKELFDIGMYDGWPFWEPTPAVFVKSSIGGGEWQFYYDVDSYEKLKDTKS